MAGYNVILVECWLVSRREGTSFAYMWNCIGFSFDYMSNLIKCSLLYCVISECVPLVTTVLERIYLVTLITGG